MKKINSITILLVSIIIFLVIVNLYKYTNTNVQNVKSEYLEIQKLSLGFATSKKSLYTKGKAEQQLRKITRQLNIKNLSIVKKNKKLVVKVNKISFYEQEKFLNKVLNEKFIILKLKIEKNELEIEIGTK